MLGTFDGKLDGLAVGAAEGFIDGLPLGASDGAPVGKGVGSCFEDFFDFDCAGDCVVDPFFFEDFWLALSDLLSLVDFERRVGAGVGTVNGASVFCFLDLLSFMDFDALVVITRSVGLEVGALVLLAGGRMGDKVGFRVGFVGFRVGRVPLSFLLSFLEDFLDCFSDLRTRRTTPALVSSQTRARFGEGIG